jgi:hypothetical protein
VGELEEAPLDAEPGREREREDERVGRDVAARVVSDEQDGPVGGDLLHALHVGSEVEAREQPQARQRLADVVRVALVEIGQRDAALQLVGQDAPERLHHVLALLGTQRAVAARRMRPVPCALPAHRTLSTPIAVPVSARR